MPRIPVDCPNKIICIQYDLAHFFLKKYSVTITSIHLSILFSVSHRFPNKNIHGGHLCQAKSSSSSASSASRAEQSTRQWLPAMHAMQWAAASAASASAAVAWVEPVSPPFHLKSGGWTNREIGGEREREQPLIFVATRHGDWTRKKSESGDHRQGNESVGRFEDNPSNSYGYVPDLCRKAPLSSKFVCNLIER